MATLHSRMSCYLVDMATLFHRMLHMTVQMERRGTRTHDATIPSMDIFVGSTKIPISIILLQFYDPEWYRPIYSMGQKRTGGLSSVVGKPIKQLLLGANSPS